MRKLLSLLLLLPLLAHAGSVTGTIQTASSGTVNNGTLNFSLNQVAVVSGTAQVVTTSVPCYTSNAGQIVGEPDPQVVPTLSTNTSSGTLAAGTYFVKLSYWDASGESLLGPEGTVVLGATGTVIVTAPVVQPANASGYKVYIGATSGAETLQQTVTGFGNYSQTAALSAGAPPPGANSTACKIRFQDEMIPTTTYYSITLLNAGGNKVAGYPISAARFYGGSNGTVNVSNGWPVSIGGVVYPQPIVSTPNQNAVQSINGPLSLGSFGLTAGNGTFSGIVSANVISLTSRDCRADGVKADGVTDDSAAVNTCIANAKTNKQTHVLLPCGNILLTANTINGTNFPGLHISGCALEGASSAPTQSQGITSIICNQGTTKICVDFTGSSNHEIDHMTLNVAKGINGAGIGILQGRDNAGGGGSANPLCFNQFYNIHDIYITDNGGTNTALNSGRGFIGIYNVSAENGLYSNVGILADTPMLFSQNNVLGIASPYQTLQTGCPLSMTGVTLVNPVLTGSTTTLPLIEANTTNAFSLHGFQCVGGNACIKFENTQGSTATDGWTVTGLTEQSSSDILASSVNLANMHFMMLIANPPPGVVFKPLAGNLTFDQMDFLIDDFFALAPFIDNAQTGTQIRGSKIHIGAATSASNTTLLDSEVFAPTLTDGNISFNASSVYTRYTSTGISTVGQYRFSDGNCVTPGIGFSGAVGTGWYRDSGGHVQNCDNAAVGPLFWTLGSIFGSGMTLGFSSSADPINASADTNIGRAAAKVLWVGDGNTTPDKNGFIQSANTVRVASDFTTANNTNLQTITGLSWTFPALAANYSFHCELSYSQATAAVADAFGIQAATNNPTNIFATGKVWTAAAVVTTGTLATLATTTATNILTFTPGATATNNVAQLDGTLELGASANTINIMVSTTAGADAVTVKRGSYCQLF